MVNEGLKIKVNLTTRGRIRFDLCLYFAYFEGVQVTHNSLIDCAPAEHVGEAGIPVVAESQRQNYNIQRFNRKPFALLYACYCYQKTYK
jgi:hypothetical protein